MSDAFVASVAQGLATTLAAAKPELRNVQFTVAGGEVTALQAGASSGNSDGMIDAWQELAEKFECGDFDSGDDGSRRTMEAITFDVTVDNSGSITASGTVADREILQEILKGDDEEDDEDEDEDEEDEDDAGGAALAAPKKRKRVGE